MAHSSRWPLLICALAFPLSLMADQWLEIVSPTQPPARLGHTLVTLGREIYLFGGYTPTSGIVSDSWGSAFRTEPLGAVNDFWKFDGQNWIKIADNAPPPARYLHTAVVHNNKMYVFGGQASSTTYLNDMWSYSTDTNSWQVEPQSGVLRPEARGHHSAVVTDDGAMIVYGGRGNYGENDGYAWRYEFATGEWTRKKANPTGGITCHSAVVIDGKMYVFGGKAGSRESSDIVAYDPSKDAWTPVIAQGQIPDPRAFYAITTEGASFWIFGGENTSVAAFDDGWEFNTVTRTWTRHSDLVSDATRARVAAVTNSPTVHVMFGGMDASGKAIGRTFRYLSRTPERRRAVGHQAVPSRENNDPE